MIHLLTKARDLSTTKIKQRIESIINKRMVAVVSVIQNGEV